MMIVGFQIRAARALLGWSAEVTAEKCGLTRETIQRLEKATNVPPSRTQSLLDLRKTFEDAGVEFIGGPGEGPGVRLWEK
ncbi:helix-turn-helix domain-containing protein [Aestuariivirga sp.]|uniref:helix-turn-helix domain-containing protein n=1 Tax=Aestuariivirga sp. TaxID=2650926 RepID=UPI003BAAE8F0